MITQTDRHVTCSHSSDSLTICHVNITAMNNGYVVVYDNHVSSFNVDKVQNILYVFLGLQAYMRYIYIYIYRLYIDILIQKKRRYFSNYHKLNKL